MILALPISIVDLIHFAIFPNGFIRSDQNRNKFSANIQEDFGESEFSLLKSRLFPNFSVVYNFSLRAGFLKVGYAYYLRDKIYVMAAA